MQTADTWAEGRTASGRAIAPRIPGLLGTLLVVGVACSAGAGLDASAGPPGSKADAAWRSTTVFDARTGDSFSIDDLRGRLVVIEPMAIWCSNCRIQQLEVASALARLNDPDIVYVSLDVDPNERAEDLAEYAARLGFEWRFVVATPQVARSLADTFGAQVLSPPSTPLILVGPDGEVVDQHFGLRSADELVELFSTHVP